MKRKIIIGIEIISTIIALISAGYIIYTHGEANILWCVVPSIISTITGWIREKLKK